MNRRNSYLELGTYANNLIRCKARQLIGTAGFTSADCEDIEQELALDLLQRLKHYDPTKAKETTFMALIVEHKLAKLIKDRHAACRDWRLCQESLDEPFGLDSDEPKSRLDQLCDPAAMTKDALAFELDLQAALEALPEDLRELWELMLDSNLHRVSRLTGIPRTTLYDRLRRLHDALLRAGL